MIVALIMFSDVHLLILQTLCYSGFKNMKITGMLGLAEANGDVPVHACRPCTPQVRSNFSW
jgi:hypothetical protein